jgi:hypothetical protein
MSVIEQLARIKAEEAFEKGLRQGKREVQQFVVKNLLQHDSNFSLKRIAFLTDTSLAFVKKVKKELLHNRKIDEAIARVEAGEFHTHQEVEKMAKEW